MTMPLPEVRGGIAISGIYDLEPIRLNYLNEKLGLDMAEAERNSPIRQLPATAGELAVAYGTRELPELYRQSIEYARVLAERGLPGRLLPVDGADHLHDTGRAGATERRSDASSPGDARPLVDGRP
jgi:arylformamidase